MAGGGGQKEQMKPRRCKLSSAALPSGGVGRGAFRFQHLTENEQNHDDYQRDLEVTQPVAGQLLVILVAFGVAGLDAAPLPLQPLAAPPVAAGGVDERLAALVTLHLAAAVHGFVFAFLGATALLPAAAVPGAALRLLGRRRWRRRRRRQVLLFRVLLLLVVVLRRTAGRRAGWRRVADAAFRGRHRRTAVRVALLVARSTLRACVCVVCK